MIVYTDNQANGTGSGIILKFMSFLSIISLCMYVCVCVCVFVYLDEALQYLIMCVIQAGV